MEFICENLAAGENGGLLFAGQSVPQLARRFGTPLYLMDAGRLAHNLRRLRAAARRAFDARADVCYAGKAACFKQMYRLAQREGVYADAVSAGELATALAAGFAAGRVVLHGCAKTDAELAAALDAGVGLIAVDGFDELAALSALASRRGTSARVLLRLTPGVDPHTFAAVATGVLDSKFGFSIPTGDALRAVQTALALPGIRLAGYHCHIGSQIFDAAPYAAAADIVLRFAAGARDAAGFVPEVLDLGGGFGVRYTQSDPPADPEGQIGRLGAAVKAQCAALGLPLPQVLLEPGRAAAADAGLAVYTIQAAKRLPLPDGGEKRCLLADGGMADNPRYALYGARYTVLPAEGLGRWGAAHPAPGDPWVPAQPCAGPRGPEQAALSAGEPAAGHAAEEPAAGRETGGAAHPARLVRCDLDGCCCESGDVLARDILLPDGLGRGSLVAVCTAGAYQYAMASNYNRLPRPAVVWLQDGAAECAVRRETDDDLLRCDL